VLSATKLGAVTFNQYDDFDRVYMVLKYDDPNAVVITYGEFLPDRYYDPNSSDPNSGTFGPWETVYWPSEFIALKFGVLSAGIYDLGSRTMPGIEIEQYGILENFGS